MFRAAANASQSSDFEIKLAPLKTTVRADLASWFPPTNHPEIPPKFLRLSLTQLPKFSPALKANSPRKFAILDHSRHIQIFQNDRLVLSNDFGR